MSRFILRNSHYLKLSLFATGFSGIVAEYLLATLATYFLGDSIVQWTMILSSMLFAMGLGSRLSKHINNHLLEKFILIELLLSLLVAYSAIFIYSISAFTHYEGIMIYALSLAIGLLIGLEIPMVTRINEHYQDLRVNISSVMENDYYGSLLGGVFFAFLAIPYLGITYTPFLLGLVNLGVAILLFVMLRKTMQKRWKKALIWNEVLVIVLISSGLFLAKPIELFSEQSKYLDKVVFSTQTRYQKIEVTQFNEDYWLYINGNQQLSTIDEYLYHEPMVHSAVLASGEPRKALVLGGGDGCAVRELLKYPFIHSVQLVDLDPVMTDLAKNNPIFYELNDSALHNEKVTIAHEDALHFVENDTQFYDVIIIDLPDPKGPELAQLYSREFYGLCHRRLSSTGSIITQAGSPYFATRAFYCIEKSMQAAKFSTLPLHNEVLTMGHWGWILGHKRMQQKELRQKLVNSSIPVSTKWLNQEGFSHITHFGKPLADTTNISINTLYHPVLYRYYLQGDFWKVY